jgi:hypothetical protein
MGRAYSARKGMKQPVYCIRCDHQCPSFYLEAAEGPLLQVGMLKRGHVIAA